MAKARGDSLTGDLLNWEPPKVTAGFEPGAIRGSRLASQISQAIALALKSSGLSRAEIAATMSEELGKRVSENMLDNYASEGQEAHKITLERFIVLVEVTGCTDALGFFAERLGQIVISKRHEEIVKAAVEKSTLREHKRKLAQYEQEVDAVLLGVNS